VEVPAVEGRPRPAPSSICRMRIAGCGGNSQPYCLFSHEKTGSDAKRQSSPANQVDARRDLGEMRGSAVADRCAHGGKTDAAGDGGKSRQDGPAFQTGSSGAPTRGIGSCDP
jgi:CDGSH-type Zn-finger protein